MVAHKRLQWSAEIAAPASKLYELMIGPESYTQWASAFADGSYFEGSWQQGQAIRFLTPPAGDGMVSEIAENRAHEFISIRHLGMIANGVEDTRSEAVRAWAPVYENYTFEATAHGTLLTVHLDVIDEWEGYMQEAWPKAIARLKALAESSR